jgi:hypothetical protein
VSDFDALLLDLSHHTKSVILPALVRNGLERSLFVRRLGAIGVERRAAATTAVKALCERATACDVTGEIRGLERLAAIWTADLPERVDEANRRITAQRFP